MICWGYFCGDNRLKTAPIHVLDLECGQIHIIQTTRIDAEHLDPVVRAGAHRRTAAQRADVVFDPFLAELVAFRRDESHLRSRHEPAQRAQPPANGTIAFFHAMQVSFDFKGDVTAVAATLVEHDAFSFMLVKSRCAIDFDG
jgi:hypothetical protein